jgi:hypothetical protein
MRRPRTWLPGVLCAACIPAGCGSGATPQSASAPGQVQVSLTAPTDGSTVIVRRIEVLGTIAPKDALLRVSGKRVRVIHGAFEKSVSLRKGMTHITVDATAKGFASSSTVVSVRYVPRRRPRSPGGLGAGPSSQPPTAMPPSSGGQAGGVLPAFEADAVASCSNAANVSVCTCVFEHMFRAGFDTQAKWQAVVEDWRHSFRATGAITYPPVMKNAILACAAGTGG